MTRRQASPPAQRWLLVILALVVGPWLGQGVAFAYSMSVNPQSGPAGTQVTVILSDFGAGCVVTFDGAPVAGVRGCESETTLVFDVPADASVGNHEIRADGVVAEGDGPTQSLTFRVTGTTPTAAPTGSPPVSISVADVVVGEVGSPTTVAGAVTSPAGGSVPTPSSPTTAAPVGAAAARPTDVRPAAAPRSAGFAVGCQPGQVALMRFAVAPRQARPGGAVTGSTSWGSVGTCSDVRALRVILDGKTVPGVPPAAGTSGQFEMSIPRDAKAGPHSLTLVADDDPSVVVAAVAFQVEKAKGSSTVLLAAGAAGALTLLALLLLVRRRRRKRRLRRLRRGPEPADDAWADDGSGGAGSGWGGVLDVPDIAGESDPEPDLAVAPTAVMVVEDHPTMPVVPLVVASGRHGSYYLLERQNPHAPRQANGKRGWYRDRRTQPIRGIVVDTVEPHTAGAAASEMAMGERPASAHVVVDADGALALLPDDVVATHRPAHDESTLVMLLAGVGADPVTDEVVLRHAAGWAAAKMREHAIPARLLTDDEFEAGQPGLLAGDEAFLWHRIVNLVDEAAPAETQTFDAVGAAEAVVEAAVEAVEEHPAGHAGVAAPAFIDAPTAPIAPTTAAPTPPGAGSPPPPPPAFTRPTSPAPLEPSVPVPSASAESVPPMPPASARSAPSAPSEASPPVDAWMTSPTPPLSSAVAPDLIDPTPPVPPADSDPSPPAPPVPPASSTPPRPCLPPFRAPRRPSPPG